MNKLSTEDNNKKREELLAELQKCGITFGTRQLKVTIEIANLFTLNLNPAAAKLFGNMLYDYGSFLERTYSLKEKEENKKAQAFTSNVPVPEEAEQKRKKYF